jgi:ANTAR domain
MSIEQEQEREHDLVDALRTASRALVDRRGAGDVDQALGRIVSAAVDTVPGADQGSVSIIRGRRIESRHATQDDIRKLDELQNDLEDGPCVSAIEEPPERGALLAEDLAGADAERWPLFAPRVVDAGYRAMASVSLSTAQGTRAALNLYAHAPSSFDAYSCHVAELFAIQAAVLLFGASRAEELQHAVDTRDVIGQAKGILMERFVLDDSSAFALLAESSQRTNMKLVDVARWLAVEAADRHARGGPGPHC